MALKTMKAVTTAEEELQVIELLKEQDKFIEGREEVRERLEQLKVTRRALELEEREWTTKVMSRSVGRISDITGISIHVVGRIKRQHDVELRVRQEIKNEDKERD